MVIWAMVWILGCGKPVAPIPAAPPPDPVGVTKLVPQLGHRSRITRLALTPDGRWAITADTEPEVVIWSLDDAVVVHRLRLHGDTIRDLALSPDGRHLATASDDGRVGLWHVASGRLLQTWSHPDEVESVVFSADGGRVVTGAHDGVARIFDRSSGELVEQREVSGWVEVERLDDGRIAAHTSAGVLVFRIGEPGSRRLEVERFDEAAIRGDGGRIALARDAAIAIRDGDGALRGVLEGHTARVRSLAFGPRGRLVSTSDDGTARVWDVDALRPIATFRGHGEEVDEAMFTPDGAEVISVGSDFRAHVWDAATGAARAVLGGIDNPHGPPMIVQHVQVGADGTALTGHGDGTLTAWDLGGATSIGMLRSRTVLATSLDPSPDGRYLAVAHGLQASIWDLALGQPAHALIGHQASIQQVRYAPDGGTVYTAANDSGVVAWDTSTGEARAAFVGAHQEGVRDVAVAPDGATILTGGSDDVAIWWSVDTQQPLRRLKGQPGDVYAVAFAPDGRRAVTAGEGGAFVWELATGERTGIALPGRDTTVLSAAFAPDGEHVLLGTLYRKLLRVDAASGEVVATIDVDGPVGALRVAPGGDALVVGTFDGITAVHDPVTLARRRSTDPLDSFVLDAQQLPGSPWIASAGMDGTVRFFGKGPAAAVTLITAAGDWAVTDPAGRYDVSGDASEQLAVWVVDDAPYALSQLRDEFYDPGLLARALGRSDAPGRDVPVLSAIAPPARVRLDGPGPDGRVQVAVEDRGGGIGEVFATLNDSDVSEALREACGAFTAPCTVDLSRLPTWADGLDNTLRVWVDNASGSVRSRGLTRAVTAAGRPTGDPPDLWILAVGSSDYAGTSIDLAYPDVDAGRMALALKLAGEQGFGADRTHLRVLATAELAIVEGPPGREPLEDAFRWLEGSDPLDTVVVFLAGHGVAFSDPGSGVDDYFYLLPSASSLADLRSPELRRLRTWSGDDLAEALARVPARKRVVVLDTCSAGKLDQSLTQDRALSSDAIRAHVRARHRTGAWVLAGSAADQISYEASRFGQGVLTYSLLEAMRGPALDEGDQLWVSRWFAHAEAQVPRYASDIGGVQRPVVRRGAGDFPLGELPADRRDAIRLSPVRPVLVRSLVVARGGRPDRLGLARAVDAELRRRVDAGEGIAVWDVDAAPDAAQLTGQYVERGGRLAFEGVVSRGEVEHPITAEAAELTALARAIADRVVAWVLAR